MNFAGPIIGTPVLTLVYELLNASPYYREILFGVILLAVMLFMRGGIVTLPQRIAEVADYIGRLRATKGETAAPE